MLCWFSEQHQTITYLNPKKDGLFYSKLSTDLNDTTLTQLSKIFGNVIKIEKQKTKTKTEFEKRYMPAKFKRRALFSF